MPVRYTVRGRYNTYTWTARTGSSGGSSGAGIDTSTRTASGGTTNIDEIESLQYNVGLGAGGITTIDFWDENLAISQTNHQMHTANNFTISYVMPYRGSLLAIAVSGNANKTAGTASFNFFINDAASGASCLLPNSTKYAYQKFSKGQYGWAEGSYVDMRITTDGSYAPTTVDYEVVCYLALEQSEVQ